MIMKKFIIIGSIHAACYQDIFPLIMNNEVWLGINANGHTMTFICDDGDVDVAAWWFTNLEHGKRNVPLKLNKKYNPEKYPVYDTYDAVEVSRVCDIPSDYYGVMGVPITFLEKYCPSQFKIVGKASRGSGNGWDLFDPYVGGKEKYRRLLIRRR